MMCLWKVRIGIFTRPMRALAFGSISRVIYIPAMCGPVKSRIAESFREDIKGRVKTAGWQAIYVNLMVLGRKGSLKAAFLRIFQGCLCVEDFMAMPSSDVLL